MALCKPFGCMPERMPFSMNCRATGADLSEMDGSLASNFPNAELSGGCHCMCSKGAEDHEAVKAVHQLN